MARKVLAHQLPLGRNETGLGTDGYDRAGDVHFLCSAV